MAVEQPKVEQWMREAAAKIYQFKVLGEERDMEFREHKIAEMIAAHAATPAPPATDLQPFMNYLADRISKLASAETGFEKWDAACEGIAKLLRTGWPYPDPALLGVSAPASADGWVEVTEEKE